MSRNKRLVFDDTMAFARELFTHSNCVLEQRIIRIINSLTRTGVKPDYAIKIDASLTRHYFKGKGVYQLYLKIIHLPDYPNKAEDIHLETFYVRLS